MPPSAPPLTPSGVPGPVPSPQGTRTPGRATGAGTPRGAAPEAPRASRDTGSPEPDGAGQRPRLHDFRRAAAPSTAPAAPPPPAASSRFPDAPPAGSAGPADAPHRPGGEPSGAAAGSAPPRPAEPPRRTALPEETLTESTTRLRPVRDGQPTGWTPASSSSRRSVEALDQALGGRPRRPYITFARPETYHPETHDGTRSRPSRPRRLTAATCVVLGLGLIGGAVTGSWLTGDADADGDRGNFAAAEQLWHSVPVDQLFPRTLDGEGAGPGGADRTWTRIAVAPDTGCEDAFDPLLRKALAPVGCLRLLRATYTDATRSHVTTVGLLFTTGDFAAMASLKSRFEREGLDRRTDLMPLPYAAQGTLADRFGAGQRASWTLSVLTDAPVVVYAVSGFTDGRTITEPEPAEEAMKSGATTAPAQSGLGHEAQGLADRVERGFRKTVASAVDKAS
ncbi:hypothetical protein [Streptomyces acidicola]|uniref:hypothetical protein n=1 Tax=Streptomyces acidicola TaxID=2596892 RepID=UPI001D14B822|nr:hypothetical protein [Streptomyces acidicola]